MMILSVCKYTYFFADYSYRLRKIEVVWRNKYLRVNRLEWSDQEGFLILDEAFQRKAKA